MELGGGGRRGAGDRVRRQLQSVGRLAAYLGGSFLVLSAASSVAVRSLRALSDANQVRACPVPCPPRSANPFAFATPFPATDSRTSSEEVRYAVRRLRWEGNLRVQALQGQRHHRVVFDARPRVRQSMPLPYLRWGQGSALLELRRKRLCLKKQCVYLDW